MHRYSLESVLAHQDAVVVARFTDEFDVTIADAQEVFDETRRWVWLCAEARADRNQGLTVPPLMIDRFLLFIDEGWHNWILHTRAYRTFCDREFGFYVDHNPTPKPVKDTKKTLLDERGEVFAETLSQREGQYSYIFDKLGGDTLERWYSTLAEKYWRLPERRKDR